MTSLVRAAAEGHELSECAGNEMVRSQESDSVRMCVWHGYDHRFVRHDHRLLRHHLKGGLILSSFSTFAWGIKISGFEGSSALRMWPLLSS